jgi:fructosamine-3-kinase
MITLIKTQLQLLLEDRINEQISSFELKTISGGSINQAYQLTINNQLKFFCKTNDALKFPGLFLSEKSALDLLAAQGIFRIPKVILLAELSGYQVLVLEFIEPGVKTTGFWKRFGEQLSRLHSLKNDSFGLSNDNYMGALKQSNKRSSDWNEFFFNERILPQVRLATNNGLLSADQAKSFDRLPALLPQLFPDAEPCLLHGDLWSGNYLCDTTSNPVLIDPAIYYGHPSIDLGMTTLFGGFEKTFYDSYNYHTPFTSNHRLQWEISNLYPLLIHLNLFGKSYLGEVMAIMQRYF